MRGKNHTGSDTEFATPPGQRGCSCQKSDQRDRVGRVRRESVPLINFQFPIAVRYIASYPTSIGDLIAPMESKRAAGVHDFVKYGSLWCGWDTAIAGCFRVASASIGGTSNWTESQRGSMQAPSNPDRTPDELNRLPVRDRQTARPRRRLRRPEIQKRELGSVIR